MVDYISRQAAIDAIANCTNCGTPDELRKYVDKHSLENVWTGGVLEAMEAVEDIPAADVAPVIRCKECKYFMSPHACSHDDGMITAQSNGFCSYGERKE